MAEIKIYGTLKNDTGEPIVYGSQVQEDAEHRFVTDAEREKLNGVADGANKYEHPATHPASMIKEDSKHRFVTDAEREKWNEVVLLPISGVCGSRAEMPGYGVWAFADEESDGIWTIEGDFASFGLTRSDYCNSVGISGDRWVPKFDAVYQSIDPVEGSRLWVVVDSTGRMERMATKGDLEGLQPEPGPIKVDAADVTTDATRRFVSDAEKQKWNEAAIPALLPIDGVCGSRGEVPGYGVWAFADEEMGGMWCIEGDFEAYGLTRRDYCVSVGIDGSRWVPKPEGVYRCVDYKGVQRIYTVDPTEGKNRLVAMATVEDVPEKQGAGFTLPVLPVESVGSVYESEAAAAAAALPRSGGMVLSQIAYGGAYKWVLRGDASVYGLSSEDYGVVDAVFGFIIPRAGLLLYSVGDVCFYRTVEVDSSVAVDGVTVERCAWVDAAVDVGPVEITADEIAGMAAELRGGD